MKTSEINVLCKVCMDMLAYIQKDHFLQVSLLWACRNNQISHTQGEELGRPMKQFSYVHDVKFVQR